MDTQSCLPVLQNAPAIISTMPSQQELMVYQTWAKNACESQMYRNVGKEAGIMMIILAGREYGIGPAQALNGGLHIIEGKVELSAKIMLALIRRAKHTIKILEDTVEKCTIYGCRGDTGEEYTVSYTIEDAQRAGLIKDKGAWRKVPDDMLFARCTSKLARRLFTDVIGIGYIEGEISASEGFNGDLNGTGEMEVIQVQEDHLQIVLDHFKKEDHSLVLEFIKTIQENFSTSQEVVLKGFVKDLKGAEQKFQAWKSLKS